MAGVSDAYWVGQKKKIKFIAGIEIYFNENHLELVSLQENKDWKIGSLKTSKTATEIGIEQIEKEEKYDSLRRNRHLTVLAMNMVGYRNLIHMTSQAWEIGSYYKPRVWFDCIKKYNEGLIILSGCLNGPVCHALRQAAKYLSIASGKYTKDKFNRTISINREDALRKKDQWLDEANMWVVKFRDLLGDRFYLELQMPGEEIPFGKEAFALIAGMAKKYDIKAVVTNDCHFTNRPDFKVQKCMMAVEQGVTIDDPNLFHVDSDEQFFKSRAQLRQTYHEGGYSKSISPEDFEECLENTVRLAERCETFSPDIEPKLPQIPQANQKLFKLTMKSLADKGLLNSTKKYKVDGLMVTHKQQAIIELRRYIEKDFSSYFLIIRDLVNHSKTNGWDIGPGRGSAGGSLVCYLLGIHSLDPLKWGLSSVRFMGDSRGGNMLNVSME
jgi:DNA polymerase-3 subunit alpha